MINRLIEHQAAIQAQVDKYAPTREVFEEFLKSKKGPDAEKWPDTSVLSIFRDWVVSLGTEYSRYELERQEVINTADGREVMVEAYTDPRRYKFGREAGDVRRALIQVRVSLPENPVVTQELELPPVWAILEHDSGFSSQNLEKLERDLEDIVPLVRACLLGFNPLTNESKEFS